MPTWGGPARAAPRRACRVSAEPAGPAGTARTPGTAMAAGTAGAAMAAGSAGAGGAAHLPGMIASLTTLPVIGVPLKGGVEGGMDSLLATVQMPKGVPVATVTIGKHGAINAAILCAEILSLNDKAIEDKLTEFKNLGAKL